MASHTPSQQEAIRQRGNVLVMAGAGAGKTSTLVERCLAWLMDPAEQGTMDRLLMVTFTEAAAAEMRKRIRESLEKRQRDTPENVHLVEQIALLDTAHIQTLHSFCYELVRRHFYELSLDPQMVVLKDGQDQLLAAEVLDDLLGEIYAGKHPEAGEVQRLILERGHGNDRDIRSLTLRLHRYAQSLRDANGWLAGQIKCVEQEKPLQWRDWLRERVLAWSGEWMPILQQEPAENLNAARCAGILATLAETSSDEQMAEVLQTVQDYDKDWSFAKKTKTKYHKPIEKLFQEAKFYGALLPGKPGPDPLQEDWDWCRPQMLALLRLTRQFSGRYAERKRQQAVLDFSDLEQFALRLLWNSETGRPSPVAEVWRERFRLVFVDEYQDINEAQDAILLALSREGLGANRFLVGDVKQGIYRFRLANPHIFQSYMSRWRQTDGGGRVIALTENFRSHEAILHFINELFRPLMRSEMGGVVYDEDAALRYGAPEGRPMLRMDSDPVDCRRVEMHFCVTSKTKPMAPPEESESDGLAPMEELAKDAREARLITERLQRFIQEKTNVWDSHEKIYRALKWSDVVILLRSPRTRVDAYAKEFDRAQIPLVASRSGFFESQEVADLLDLMRLLDNPLQDLPLLTVLRSPLVGLSLDELATIRLAERKARLWTAMNKWCRQSPTDAAGSPALTKVRRFLENYERWRVLARQGALSDCLETVLDETHYADWCRAQDRGEQRHANVQRLLALIRQFDPLQRQGLFRFLEHVQALSEAEVNTEPASIKATDAVRLMSIHQSKGLEFPVVVVTGLGGRFNLQDITADIILDETYGVCPRVKPPQTGQRYPSIVHHLAALRQRRESLGEELRLLYVAGTRAIERLLLFGTADETTLNERWSADAAKPVSPVRLLKASTPLDWIAPLILRALEHQDDTPISGKATHFECVVHAPALPEEVDVRSETQVPAEFADITMPEELQKRLLWQYPQTSATMESAKTTVTALRRRQLAVEEGESRVVSFGGRPGFEASRPGTLSAAERGRAHHLFLQYVPLTLTGSVGELKFAAEQLRDNGLLAVAEFDALDFSALAQFWQSEAGTQIRCHPAQVHRELPFIARLTADDMFAAGLALPLQALKDEFMVVQGIADLVVTLPHELWVVDFKTDGLRKGQLEQKIRDYAPQLQLYGIALSRIFQRPLGHLWLHFLNAKQTVDVMPA
ncbi:MAG: helicase-exonuclease AddAB subunit AddA [Verrucomicrobiota bacterium]